MQIEVRQLTAFGDDFDAVELRQQRHQFRLHFAYHPRAGTREQQRIADELNRIAKSLLGMKQNGLAGKRHVALPERLTKERRLLAKAPVFQRHS